MRKAHTISFPAGVYLLLVVLVSDWKRRKEKAAFNSLSMNKIRILLAFFSSPGSVHHGPLILASSKKIEQ
ncbi:MAG: hypothetical protein RI973_1750 [Bacteroidota bacterium]|jgi:hypothetical protein